MNCSVCGKRAYSSFCVAHKPRTAIKITKKPPQRGKQYHKYAEWKRTVATPYLDTHYGHTCAAVGCSETQVDIDHILTRGSRPDLKYELTNLRYLCRPHHRLVTDGFEVEMKYGQLKEIQDGL